MKSALELAMEKTAKMVSQEDSELTESQKRRISDIEAEFQAKVAEAEIMLEQKSRGIDAADPELAEAALESLREEFRKDKESWASKRAREITKVKGKKSS